MNAFYMLLIIVLLAGINYTAYQRNTEHSRCNEALKLFIERELLINKRKS